MFWHAFWSREGENKDVSVLSKLLCLTHSEAKQTKTSEFGAEKVYCKGQARRTRGSFSKGLNSLMVFLEVFLNVKFAGCVSSFGYVCCEVTGWYLWNLHLWFQAVWGLWAYGQHIVTILHLPGHLSFCLRTQRYVSLYYLYPFWRN